MSSIIICPSAIDRTWRHEKGQEKKNLWKRREPRFVSFRSRPLFLSSIFVSWACVCRPNRLCAGYHLDKAETLLVRQPKLEIRKKMRTFFLFIFIFVRARAKRRPTHTCWPTVLYSLHLFDWAAARRVSLHSKWALSIHSQLGCVCVCVRARVSQKN